MKLPNLTTEKKKRDEFVKPFAQHVVYGEKDLLQANLKHFLKTNQQLLKIVLTHCVQVVDYSNRTVEGTLLRLVMGADDVGREDHPDEGMENMILELMHKALGDEAKAEIAKQLHEQFPPGWRHLVLYFQNLCE